MAEVKGTSSSSKTMITAAPVTPARTRAQKLGTEKTKLAIVTQKGTKNKKRKHPKSMWQRNRSKGMRQRKCPKNSGRGSSQRMPLDCMKGIKSIVLERSDELRATGAAINVLTNGWRALDQLGIGPELRQKAVALSNYDSKHGARTSN
ncbi:hypothetical protein QJS10_CPA08g00941 [Acorus calamus]|uniref:Uncharacterized protein n=1 Tax=Acorus calamus TaxID=4465 RepID=A0AAV9EBZ1_ACOCL|nr:hypothetical protein QJS10_CPA08g00941 [Acorus calamus]